MFISNEILTSDRNKVSEESEVNSKSTCLLMSQWLKQMEQIIRKRKH